MCASFVKSLMSMAYNVKTALTAPACFATRKTLGPRATTWASMRAPTTTAPIHHFSKAGLRWHPTLQSCWLVTIVYMR